MVNAQEWLDKNYPKKEKARKYLFVKEQLEGELYLKDFTNLKKVYISYYVNEKQFTINYEGKIEVVKLVNAQEWLDANYPKVQRGNITKLNLKNKNLEGGLDLSDFVNLEELECDNNKLTLLILSKCSNLSILLCSLNQLTDLNIINCNKLKEIKCPYNQLVNLDCCNLYQLKHLDCSNNYLTQIIYPSHSVQLTHLNISSNNLSEQDCSAFSQFGNLENLKIGNHDENKINQKIYNRFMGSLEPFKNSNKLKHLNISNTDIASGVEHLPQSIGKIRYSSELRPTSKVQEIDRELCFFINKEKRREWENLGFNFAEIKSWIEIGLEFSDYDFANYLKERKICLSETKTRLDELRKEYWEFKTSKQSEEKINFFIEEANLEKIPYKQLDNIEYLTEGGFGKIYIAEWNWQDIILKSLNNSQNLTPEILREVASHKLFDNNTKIVKCHGISQDPKTKNYLMVMDYVVGGNLREYLQRNNNKLNLKKRFIKLHSIAEGLENIHNKGLVHKDFHAGNILSRGAGVYFSDLICLITDLGLCRPVNIKSDNEIYGVLPYVAPEVLQGQPYTQASDIYSFGIISYEILSGYPPYYKCAHDEFLGLKICQGLRPNLGSIKVPQPLKELIKKCWDVEPKQRPIANELLITLNQWKNELNEPDSLIAKQARKAEEFNRTLLPNEIRFPKYKKHEEAVYTSRLLPTEEIIKLLQNSKEISEQFYDVTETPESFKIDLVNFMEDSSPNLAKKEAKTKQKLLREILVRNNLIKETFLKQTISNLEEQMRLFSQEKNIGQQNLSIAQCQLTKFKKKSIKEMDNEEYWKEIYQLQESFAKLQTDLEKSYQLSTELDELMLQQEISPKKRVSQKINIDIPDEPNAQVSESAHLIEKSKRKLSLALQEKNTQGESKLLKEESDCQIEFMEVDAQQRLQSQIQIPPK